MSRFTRLELVEPYYYQHPSLLFRETSIIAPKTLSVPFPSFVEDLDEFSFDLDFLSHRPPTFDAFDSFTDLIQINEAPLFSSYRRVRRVERSRDEFLLQRLSDRVSELESRFDRLMSAKISCSGDRKYTWTNEIKGTGKHGVDRKYKLAAEIKEGKRNECDRGIVQNYKWTAEIKGKDGKDPTVRKYTVEVSSHNADENGELKEEEKKKKGKKAGNEPRVVEIEDTENHGAVILRQAFAKRARVIANRKGKRKELSPQDAAVLIQISFRAHLIRRSQVLRALRDLTVAKSKLKEIRASFNNFAYRQRLAHDAEERQRFTEKIIVLLITVDDIEGADMMVRAAKRSMIDELEAMLDVVDPQPTKKSLSFRRRTFDMPSGSINKELAAGVAQVVELIDQAENSAAVFEACV